MHTPSWSHGSAAPSQSPSASLCPQLPSGQSPAIPPRCWVPAKTQAMVSLELPYRASSEVIAFAFLIYVVFVYFHKKVMECPRGATPSSKGCNLIARFLMSPKSMETFRLVSKWLPEVRRFTGNQPRMSGDQNDIYDIFEHLLPANIRP